MKRDLLKQFFNEWRDNFWLIVEFILVFVTIWVIAAYIIAMTHNLWLPMGMSPENIYQLSVKYIDNSSPEYIAPDNGGNTDYIWERNELMNRLRENEYVEYIAIHNNALPYNFNFNGSWFLPLDFNDSVPYIGNSRKGSEELIDILKPEPVDGTSIEELREIFKRGDLILSENQTYSNQGRDVWNLKGKRMIYPSDSTKSFKVAAIINPIRRNDYEAMEYGTSLDFISQNAWNSWMPHIAVRVKPGMGKKFEEAFNTDVNLRKFRNVYVTDIVSIENMKRSTLKMFDGEVRIMLVCVAFLIFTIFLGLLGTFWFRVQRRVSEIAIRKVCGATNGQVFRRLFGEGFIIYAIAVIISSIFVWIFHEKVEALVNSQPKEFIIAELIALVICALGLLISLYAPARRVIKIEPAIAIKEE